MNGSSRLVLWLLLLGLFTCPAWAASEPSATVTDLSGEVRRGPGKPPAPEKSAAVRDVIGAREYVRTSRASLAELQLTNANLTRIGPLTVFRFAPESSNFILERGEGLFVFPKGKGGSTVTTPAFAAGILGTTVYVRADRSTLEYSCLEGHCRIGPHILAPGEKLVLRGSRLSYTAPKQRFNLRRFLAENPLVNNFVNPLPSRPLIQAEADQQP